MRARAEQGEKVNQLGSEGATGAGKGSVPEGEGCQGGKLGHKHLKIQ